MSGFSSIPDWNGIHPAMVQFPIVLLFAAPLLLIVSLFARQAWRTWVGAALLVMAIGALGAWLAVASGHAGGQLVDKTPALERAIASHEAFGVMTRNLFTLLTLVLAALVLVPAALKRPLPAALRIGAYGLFVVVYAACTMALANTAYRGGRLVHELGVRAMVVGANQQTAMMPAVEAKAKRAVTSAPPGGTRPANARPADRKAP